MSSTDISIVGLFVGLATLIFAPEVAGLVGPYMAIAIAAAVGASFALVRREGATRWRNVWFFVRVIGLATLLSAGAADVVHMYIPTVDTRVWLAPIALVIGLVGDDLPALARWAGQKINAFVDAMIKFKTGGGGGGANG